MHFWACESRRITCDASWTKVNTPLGSPYYSTATTALAWCSGFCLGGPMEHQFSSLLLRRLLKSQALGALKCPAMLHRLVTTEHALSSGLAECQGWHHTVVWGLLLSITSLEFQTTRGNWEVPVPPWFVVFKLSQRMGAEEAMWVGRHIQGITCQSALQQATRRCAWEINYIGLKCTQIGPMNCLYLTLRDLNLYFVFLLSLSVQNQSKGTSESTMGSYSLLSQKITSWQEPC